MRSHVNYTTIHNPLFLEYGLWRLKQGRAEATVIENIRKLKRIAKYADLDQPEDVKAYIAKGAWRKSYKEAQVTAYQSWCAFRNISFTKPKYHRDENLPFIPLAS